MRVFVINKNNVNLLNDINGSNGPNHGTVLFHHPQCPHCVSMRPDWENMKDSVTNEECNIYEVNGESMHDIKNPIVNQVNGFPTIVNFNNGKLQHFEQERNVHNMRNFVLSNLSQNRQLRNNATRKLQNRKVSFELNNNNDLTKQRIVARKPTIINSIHLYREKAKRKNTNKNSVKSRKPKRKQKKQTKRKRSNENNKPKSNKKRKTQKK